MKRMKADPINTKRSTELTEA